MFRLKGGPVDLPPSAQEKQQIETAMKCLELMAKGMDGRCESLLQQSRALIFGDLGKSQPSQYDRLIADAIVTMRVAEGIHKKLELGSYGDQFEAIVGEEPGLSTAYTLGQMLVQRNREIEQGFFARLLRRTGPLHPDKLGVVLRASTEALGSWIARSRSESTKEMTDKASSIAAKDNTATDTEIRMQFWVVDECQVTKKIQYFGYSPNPTTLHINFTCKWGTLGFKQQFLSLVFYDRLAAEPGYLTARFHNRSYDSGFCVVRLDQRSDRSTIIGLFESDDVSKIAAVLSGEEAVELWLGGPSGDLLRLPVPPESGLSGKFDEAFNHPSSRE